MLNGLENCHDSNNSFLMFSFKKQRRKLNEELNEFRKQHQRVEDCRDSDFYKKKDLSSSYLEDGNPGLSSAQRCVR